MSKMVVVVVESMVLTNITGGTSLSVLTFLSRIFIKFVIQCIVFCILIEFSVFSEISMLSR
jgi:hypothetical protein